MDVKLLQNQETWDRVAEQFLEASSLPQWGPFGVGVDLNLIPTLEGKSFLEIACGSGRSIKYLIDNGASKVYGLDISKVQLDEAKKYNQLSIDAGKIQLFHQPMEELIQIEPVDYVMSIYGIGWTPDPKLTLQNIYSYLKPGGLFIWSWDHTFFTDILYKDGDYVVTYSYHEEKPLALKDWKNDGTTAHLTYRKTSTWFRLLQEAGFEVVGYHEPAPVDLSRGFAEPDEYYSIDKAKKIPATFIFVCKKN